jgi:DNA-directed RNA polymerase II subunit RPB7
MPSAFRYDANATPPQWIDESDQITVIEKGAQVRFKVKGTRPEATNIFAIATIKEVS